MKIRTSILLMIVAPLLLGGFLLSVSPAVAVERMQVTFLNPGAKGDAFFGMMTSFMQAVAYDLGIDLEVVYCDRDHLKMHDNGVALLSRKRLPEYLILINEKNAGEGLLEMASGKGVKVALINEGLQGDELERFKAPGEVLPNWVLEYLPDDKQAGYMLGKALIKAARDRGLTMTGDVNVVAISGNYQTGSSTGRLNGLSRAVLEDGRAKLLQSVPAYWLEGHARQVAAGLVERYPEADVLWAASDVMARGALSALSDQKNRPVLGGIDWAEFALQKVQDGEFAATVGGHFMDGGWALVMLYDLHHGVPLEKSRILSQFSLITQKNVQEYLKHFGDHDWDRIDFRRFSRYLNPAQTRYRFGLEAVMEELGRD